MKIAIYAIAAVVVLGVAYSLGPDIARYMKIKSM
jgi:hypothetical protein